MTELASLDGERGLSLFFQYWAEDHSLDRAMRRAFGITLVGFEKEFQSRTRRRYGALALFADMSIVVLILTLLMLPLFVTRRIRVRRRLAALLAAERAAERLDRERAIEMLLALGSRVESASADLSPTSGERHLELDPPPKLAGDDVSDGGSVA